MSEVGWGNNIKRYRFHPIATGVRRTSHTKSLGGSEPVLKTVSSNHPLKALVVVRVLTCLFLDGALLDIYQNRVLKNIIRLLTWPA